MKRWLVIAGLLVAILTAWVLVMIFRPSNEPTWHGRTLTEWLDRARVIYVMINKPSDEDPIQALNEIGTNALPILIKMLEAKDGPLKGKFIDVVNSQRLVNVRLKTAGEKVSAAMNGFRYLGTNALPALPQMLRLTQNRDTGTRMFATSCISNIRRFDPLLCPALEGCLNDPDTEVKRGAAQLLMRFYPAEAERLGLPQKFPDLKPPVVEGGQTNAAAGQN